MSSASTAYYDTTASGYDSYHDSDPTHTRALELAWPLFPSITSVLDVGCGTGRSLKWFSTKNPGLKLHGVEPSAGMLGVARRSLPNALLTQGVGEKLDVPTKSVDLAVATGIMHHADNPSAVIAEMFRVARKCVLISDHNNYAFGGDLMRRTRLVLKGLGLLKHVLYVRQGFKHKGYSEEDGWWYPYSLFDDFGQIAGLSRTLHLIPTRAPVGAGNILYSQGHVAILAFPKD